MGYSFGNYQRRHGISDKQQRSVLIVGAYYGTAASGGYIGMASYLLKNGTVSTSTNDVLVGTRGQTGSTSTTVCTSPMAAGSNACGAVVTCNPGAFKFSLFGGTHGNNFQLDAGTTHLGIRTKLSLQGTTANVLLNADVALANIGTTDVTKLKLVETTGDRRTLQIDFPTKYNVGTSTSYTVPTATRDVKIKVSSVANENAINIDYLFDAADLNAKDRWFIYDPPVTDQGPGTGAASAAKEVFGSAFLLFLHLICFLRV